MESKWRHSHQSVAKVGEDDLVGDADGNGIVDYWDLWMSGGVRPDRAKGWQCCTRGRRKQTPTRASPGTGGRIRCRPLGQRSGPVSIGEGGVRSDAKAQTFNPGFPPNDSKMRQQLSLEWSIPWEKNSVYWQGPIHQCGRHAFRAIWLTDLPVLRRTRGMGRIRDEPG